MADAAKKGDAKKADAKKADDKKKGAAPPAPVEVKNINDLGE